MLIIVIRENKIYYRDQWLVIFVVREPCLGPPVPPNVRPSLYDIR